MKKPLLLIIIILIIDQALKLWIKSNMYLGQEYVIFPNWAIIHFTENNGMAFGMELAGYYGKLMLSLFRVFAIAGLGYYLYWLVKHKQPQLYIYCIAMVFAGAFGNIIDSAFYGIIFNDSYNQVATLFPPEGGYAPFLFGRVVDMFYFPIVQGHFPQWFPLWGGEDFIFFRPVFNFADFSITVGVSLIVLNQRKFFAESSPETIAENKKLPQEENEIKTN
ncbi:MAG: lipoprotein signal peptidase [Bacteroidia bacterium]|nr:lipoprotein signal peptidase [Bacteroidia bacterium]